MSDYIRKPSVSGAFNVRYSGVNEMFQKDARHHIESPETGTAKIGE